MKLVEKEEQFEGEKHSTGRVEKLFQKEGQKLLGTVKEQAFVWKKEL